MLVVAVHTVTASRPLPMPDSSLVQATWILAAVTALLVTVTAYYALQTRRTVVEMQRQRMDSALPVVVFRHSPMGDNAEPNLSARHGIVNQGPGTALQISADVQCFSRGIDGGREPKVLHYDIAALGPGAEHEVFIVLSNDQIVGFSANYRDAYGQGHKTVQKVTIDRGGEVEYS